MKIPKYKVLSGLQLNVHVIWYQASCVVIQEHVLEWRVSTTVEVYSTKVTVNQEFTGPAVSRLELFRLIKFVTESQTARLEKTRNIAACGTIIQASHINRHQLLAQSKGFLMNQIL